MKKIVSFFGEDSNSFAFLNKKAKEYALAKNLDYEWIIQAPFDEQSVIRSLQQADAGIIDVEPYGEPIFSMIDQRTKILVRFGVGYDKVDLHAASAHHIAIARTTGANTTAVAEMALTLMLNVKRMIAQNIQCVEKNGWEKQVAHEIIGSTVGIVGFGAIGRQLAKLLKGFDCRILAFDPYPNMAALEEAGAELVSLEQLFQRADAVSIHVPLCNDTKNLVNETLLDYMKPSAVIINTSRGGVVDENALYKALKNGRIAGAGIDVFAKEPLPPDSPLRTLSNVVLTPHVSSQTYESLWNIYKMAIDIIADYFEGKRSEHILNAV